MADSTTEWLIVKKDSIKTADTGIGISFLDSDVLDRPLNIMIPKFLQFFKHSSPKIRYLYSQHQIRPLTLTQTWPPPHFALPGTSDTDLAAPSFCTAWHFCGCLCAPMLGRVRPFATPRTVAHRAPPPMGLSRQEYWRGLPCPPPGALPDPGFEPGSPALRAVSFLSEPPGKQRIT